MARKKKKYSPATGILIFVTTIVIVTTFIYLRGKRRHKVTDIFKYTNASINSYQNVKNRDSRRTLLNYSFRKKKLADALWTMKPNIPNQWQFSENVQHFDISHESKASREDDDEDSSDDDVKFIPLTYSDDSDSKSSYMSYDTTPSVTERPTTPITTQSETTPIYTETPTSPITTEAVTTPGVTEAGEIEVTTEIDPDTDPNETIMLIRQRRGAFGFTPTSPDPLTTSVKPPNCGGQDNYTDDSENYYTGPEGDCECGYNMTGPYCSEEVTEEEYARRLAASLQFNTAVDGQYDNSQRAAFQQQLEQHYASLPGFQRVFVLPLLYDPATNKTSLNFILFFNDETDAEDAARSASKTYDIVGSILPILIDNQPVTFGENDTTLTRQTIDGQVQNIPLPSQNKDNVCYIYNQLQTCDHGENRGKCVNNNGTPMCECTTGYIGEFCEEPVRYAPESEEEEVLPILVPLLAGLGAMTLTCCCCFACCRRCYKGDDEASSYTESLVESPPLILPRYYPFAFKQFIAGAEAEEAEISRLVVERPVIQPVIVERTIVKERAVKQVVEEAVVPVVREAVVPVVQEVVVPVVHDVPVVRERAILEDVPIRYENAGYIHEDLSINQGARYVQEEIPVAYENAGYEREDLSLNQGAHYVQLRVPREDRNVRYFREDLRPFIRENGGSVWGSSSHSNDSTAITSPSMILPRFYATPYKQFIPGSEGDEEEIITTKRP